MSPQIAAILAARRRRDELRQPYERVSTERLEAFEKSMAEMRKLGDIFRAYDRDKTSRLEPNDVKKLLRDINNGEEPSQEEMDFIFKTCDNKCENGAIDFSELKSAIESWKVYLRHKDDMQEALKKFDASNSGKLERDELKQYLVHLNGGLEVTEDEVDYVLAHADVFRDGACSTQELVLATAAWYTLVQKKKENAACCCVVS
mmetsp:Transcript_125963/g.352697  ORF Transcript_125963/g.352697 Transcript_125963/m.352697 type:complete len:203 (+) Transcript_125963:67-675(+)